MTPSLPTLQSPGTGVPLQLEPGAQEESGVLRGADDADRWPLVLGVPWLRTGREGLRSAALDRLDGGDARSAAAVLLGDADDWWDEPPPPVEQRLAALDAATLRDAVALLGLGRVGDYLVHRWSDPTYLSGLALLAEHWPGALPAVEVACGHGPYLRELGQRGVQDRTGVDVVLAKLWLGRRFVDPGAAWVCSDVAAGPVLPEGPDRWVLCHDALYFVRDKPRAVAGMRALAGPGGAVVVGHAHNALVDTLSAGEPLEPAAWAGLLGADVLYADEELQAALLGCRPPRPSSARELAGTEAVAAVAGSAGPATAGVDLAVPPAGRPLVRSPLLAGRAARHGDADLAGPDLAWPSERWAREYGPRLGHLTDLAGARVPARVEAADRDAAADDLARRRALLDLPEDW